MNKNNLLFIIFFGYFLINIFFFKMILYINLKYIFNNNNKKIH